jgi:L-ribulokinase
MFAATAAGLYPRVEEAMQAMGQGFDAEYYPNQELVPLYQKRYEQYKAFGSFIEEQTTPKLPNSNREHQTSNPEPQSSDAKPQTLFA